MNLGSLDVNLVHQNRPHLRVSTSERSITPLNARLEADRSPSYSSSPSEPQTVIPWHTPLASPRRSIPSEQSAPTTPRRSAHSERSFQSSPRRTIHSEPSVETIRPERQYIGSNEAAYASNTPLVVRFDEEQIRSAEAEASKRDPRMQADFESGPPTPVDDTPYIRFAIDQITRDEELRTSQSTSASSDTYPVERIIPDYGLGYLSAAEREREALALVRKHRSTPSGERGLFKFNPTAPLPYTDHPSEVDVPPPPKPKLIPGTDVFIPVEPPVNTPRYPDLTFVPTILRPLSIITLSCLCLLMIAALIFCAIYSEHHHGFLEWSGGIYGPRYFLFSFLPQILAACIFTYVQAVMSAVTRITPYTMMAMDDAQSRGNALFAGATPRSMLYPKWDGPVSLNISNSFFWLSIFTIPLQSCLFSVIMVDGVWRWATVQGIAWTLVAVYFFILIGTVIMGLFFSRRITGLMWDPRSLADIIALLPRSNCLRDYAGTDLMRNKEDIRHKLARRSDRLGYWRTPDKNQGIFYCVGEEGASTRQYTIEAGKLQEKTGIEDGSSDIEKATVMYDSNTRFRYLPWFLRDTFVVFWSVAAFIIILAIFIVSFLPVTAIREGFPPLTAVLPDTAAFSSANFLYSFIPSVIGMLLYLVYQPLDMAVRKLQPWTELGKPEGATAEESLLLDYPFAPPILCSINALSAGHYRVATTSFLSFIFIIFPILAGGLFFPLTVASGAVRMIPNLSAFYVILALLVLYLIGFLILIPGRFKMQLPHGVDCLAEIFSFVWSSQMLDDAQFRAPRSKADLTTRLMARKAKGDVNKYAFGVYRGSNARESLGIERLGRRGSQEVMVLSGR